ncbi:hypothetical protein MM221_02770 [Salipaludibacillus sp. LMS25]|uniref:hypothetical protein n=1 Tax=Salipaludibacillus sp. LMS25 TaxID=2924031 RepID=UPI0020D0869C|nr:hypothetical protein [Salipaludibacillus sp. LMS25]UTR15529.1 hypothetical protein MM221_02770 [Salipaludibacillus sp. LMS25]
MNKKVSYFLLIVSCLVIPGCEETNEPKIFEKFDEGKLSQVDIFDFENLGKAPEATEKQPINKVIKVFFDEWSFDAPYEPIAINIKSNEIYVNPSLSLHSFSSYEETIHISEAETVLDILEKYNVQEWERNYTFEDPDTYEDGYSWSLLLQFEDGTVEKHSGTGTDSDDITPDNFDDFAKELNDFVNERLDDN